MGNIVLQQLREYARLIPLRWYRALRPWNHRIHIVAVITAALFLAGFIPHVPEAVHIIAVLIFGVYVFCYLLLWIAVKIANPTAKVLRTLERVENIERGGLHLRGLRSGDAKFVIGDEDLNIVVMLCDQELGMEHPNFTEHQRQVLYQGWRQGNRYSLLLITPRYGSANGSPIGVSIVLPLRDSAVSHLWAQGGGVLKLHSGHILNHKRKEFPTLFIDTLLVRAQFVEEYRSLAIEVLHQHLGIFYHERSWKKTTLYVPTMNAQIEDVLIRHGFHHRGKTVENQAVYQLAISQVPSLARQECDRYERNLSRIRFYSTDWRLGGLWPERNGL